MLESNGIVLDVQIDAYTTECTYHNFYVFIALFSVNVFISAFVRGLDIELRFHCTLDTCWYYEA